MPVTGYRRRGPREKGVVRNGSQNRWNGAKGRGRMQGRRAQGGDLTVAYGEPGPAYPASAGNSRTSQVALLSHDTPLRCSPTGGRIAGLEDANRQLEFFSRLGCERPTRLGRGTFSWKSLATSTPWGDLAGGRGSVS